jgi:hypothetical protein
MKLITGVLVALLTLSLTSCGYTYFRAVPLNPHTGYFPTATPFNQTHPARKAPILINRKTDLARYHGNILVTASRFWVQEIRYTGAFQHVMTYQDFEKKIIRAGLSHRITSLDSLLGLHHAYKIWGPFLWVHIQTNILSGNRHGMHKAELLVINPLTTRKLFVTRERFRTIFSKRVNDQYTYYPMLNSFIEWIRENGGHLHPRPHR